MVDFISIQINRQDIIYDDKVKKTKSSNGIIRLKNPVQKAYVIFPIYRKNTDGKVLVAVDEILMKTFTKMEDREIYVTDMHRKYTGRKCLMISADTPIRFTLPKREIIHNGKVNKTYTGQGIIRLKDKFLGNRVYTIFPLKMEDNMNEISVDVENVLNRGVHPDNDHMGCVLFQSWNVGKQCLIILQEG